MTWYVLAFPWAAVRFSAEPKWIFVSCEAPLGEALTYAHRWTSEQQGLISQEGWNIASFGKQMKYNPPDMCISISSRGPWE